MGQWIAMLVLSLFVATATFAQDAEPRRLTTGDEARAWEAVGRLNIPGNTFCTGALIASDLVLTAAHCLYDKSTGLSLDHRDVQFLAGWRDGRASAYRSVRRAVVHPDYNYAGHLESGQARNDLALLELSHPIRDGRIMPFDTATEPLPGAGVGVVSYGEGRSEAPSVQDLCVVLAQQDGVLVTSCSVEFGSSGAPIFVLEGGKARIVSVVSAKAEVEGEAVSLGTPLDGPLVQLRTEFAAQKMTVATSVQVGDTRRDTGAKFVSR